LKFKVARGKMKTDKVVIENTLYSLLLYWLINGVDNTTYVLEASKIDKVIIDKLKEKNNVYLFYQLFKKPKIYRFFSVYIFQKLKLYFFMKNKLNNNYLIYGNDDLIAFDIFRKFDYSILEDGLSNYIFKDEPMQTRTFIGYVKNIIRRFDKNKSFGRSDKCKKIYLTGIAPIPKVIADKVEIINLKQLWREKSKEEQKKILKTLNITDAIIKSFKNKKVILLTQPISELGFVSEKEKIEIYKNCLKKHALTDIIIKTHPREETDYKKYFPNITIIDTPFPFELITLLEIEISKVITLFSAVALTLNKDIEVEWLGASVHQKLYKLYGKTLDLENIKNNGEAK